MRMLYRTVSFLSCSEFSCADTKATSWTRVASRRSLSRREDRYTEICSSQIVDYPPPASACCLNAIGGHLRQQLDFAFRLASRVGRKGFARSGRLEVRIAWFEPVPAFAGSSGCGSTAEPAQTVHVAAMFASAPAAVARAIPIMRIFSPMRRLLWANACPAFVRTADLRLSSFASCWIGVGLRLAPGVGGLDQAFPKPCAVMGASVRDDQLPDGPVPPIHADAGSAAEDWDGDTGLLRAVRTGLRFA